MSSGEELREANEQLRLKYKKALQELMHILKVNKSLKEHLDRSAQEMELNHQQELEALRHAHHAQLDQAAQQLQAANSKIQADSLYLHELELKLKQAEGESHCLKEELKQTMRSKLHSTLNVGQTAADQQTELTKENQSLKKKVLVYMQDAREKESLQSQLQELKQKHSQLTLDFMAQNEKFRKEMMVRETEYLQANHSHSQLLSRIESKYQLLENELTNYKTVEKYLEEEARIMDDEEQVFNSIRQQIDKINEDFNRYELESSQLLLRKRQEDQNKNSRIAELEQQLQAANAQLAQFAANSHQQPTLAQQINELQQKTQQQDRDKEELTQKNQLLQTLLMAQQHAPTTTPDRIRQFEARIQLLMHEQPEDAQSYAGLHQIVMLKDYIREFSQMATQASNREQQLSRKAAKYKQQLGEMERDFQARREEYKRKISNYDALVNKLYHLLEQKLKERVPEEMEKEFNQAITHYQHKMLAMTQEIITLRQQQQQEESRHRQSAATIDQLTHQNNNYQNLIAELSKELSQLQLQNNTQLTHKDMLHQLTQQLQDLKVEKEELKGEVEELKGEVEELKGEGERKDRQIGQLSRQSIDMASLIEKINYLEYQLHQQVTVHKEQPVQDDKTEQIQSLKSQNRSLSEQLTSKHDEMMVYYNELQRKIAQQNAEAEKDQQLAELEQKNHAIIERSTQEIKELNSQIIALRTSNITLRNELQLKEDAINELKHQLFNAQLRTTAPPTTAPNNTTDSSLLMLLVLTFAEVESLRSKLEQLEVIYHEELTKYQDALKTLQSRQLQLCNSLQLSSSHQSGSHLEMGAVQRQASQLLLESATTIRQADSKPQETMGSHQSGMRSNGSMEWDSPLKRRPMVIKKI